jgi:tetratricopeptide (TPR) repeat protein
MNKGFYLIIILLALCIFLFSCSKDKTEPAEVSAFESLSGPYLGQTPPGISPKIFAPGLISTYFSQSYIVFLNNARVCVFSASTEKGHETYYTYEKEGHWTKPERAPFEELQGHPNYSTGPYGRKVYFHSGRPTHPGDTREDDNTWTIEWTGSGWAEPVALPAPANSDYGEAYPTATKDGTVYFFSWRREDTRGDDIYYSRCIEGQYQEVERLTWPINTDFIEYDPYVAPDESFLIFGSSRPGGFGSSDNYICFRKEDGNWTHAINLGRPYNSSSGDLCANGTADGKYFFFLSGRETDVDKGDIGRKDGKEPENDYDLYWADFSFIEDLKNTLLSKQNAAEIIKKDYEKNGIQSAMDRLNNLYADMQDTTYFPPYELLHLCKTMLMEGKTEGADKFFSSLNEVLPKDLSIKEGYARICAISGFVSKGLKMLEELQSEDSSYDLSRTLSAMGFLFTLYPDKTEDAISVLKFTVEKFPDDPWAYYSLARVYRQIGDLDQAIANCRKSLEIRPSIGDVSQLLERLLEEKAKKGVAPR